MNDIVVELKTLTSTLQSRLTSWARISIVLTKDGFYPLINGKEIDQLNNNYPTIEQAMGAIHREVDRLCTSEDLLAKTLGIEVAA